jgi:hypothetical protein
MPREALANVLMALMPRVAVQTRAPVRVDTSGRMLPNDTGPVGHLKKLIRGPRTRSAKGQTYKVLDDLAHWNHRDGTWRYAMVKHAISYKNDDGSPPTTLQALKAWQEDHPVGTKYHEQGIDFNWLAKVGYITFI